MVKSHKAASEMSIENGVSGVPLPLHLGADAFWTEKGVAIPEAIRAQ
jgi:hypothetical protein